MVSVSSKFPDDKALVDACLENSEDAWVVLQTLYNKLIYSIASRPGWRFSAQDTEDVCCEVYEKLFRTALKNFRFERSLKNHIGHITTNTCIDKLRKNKSLKINTLSLDQEIVEGMPVHNTISSNVDILKRIIQEETTVEINQAFMELKEKCRTLLKLKYREEMTHDQISKYLGKPLGTICSDVSRCTQKLAILVSHLL